MYKWFIILVVLLFTGCSEENIDILLPADTPESTTSKPIVTTTPTPYPSMKINTGEGTSTVEFIDRAIPAADAKYALDALTQGGTVEIDDDIMLNISKAPMNHTWVSPANYSFSNVVRGSGILVNVVIHNGYKELRTYELVKAYRIDGNGNPSSYNGYKPAPRSLLDGVEILGKNPFNLQPFETRAIALQFNIPDVNNLDAGLYYFVLQERDLTSIDQVSYVNMIMIQLDVL